MVFCSVFAYCFLILLRVLDTVFMLLTAVLPSLVPSVDPNTPFKVVQKPGKKCQAYARKQISMINSSPEIPCVQNKVALLQPKSKNKHLP